MASERKNFYRCPFYGNRDTCTCSSCYEYRQARKVSEAIDAYLESNFSAEGGTVFGVSYGPSLITGKSPLEADSPKKSIQERLEEQRRRNHEEADRTLREIEALSKASSAPSYGNHPDFIKGYQEASENRDLSPLLSLTPAAGVVDAVKAVGEFIEAPSLGAAAMVAVAAIPGKAVDKVVEKTPIGKVIKKPEGKKKEKKIKPVIKEKAGNKKDGWNDALRNPKPDTIYEVECIHNGKKVIYTYETDALGRTISVKGRLDLSPLKQKERDALNRNPRGQIKGGGDKARAEGKVESYDGGHAVGTVFMGPAEEINIVPQLSKQNRHGDWANMEKDWRKSLAKGDSVEVEIKFAYDGDSCVPSKIFGTHKIGSGESQKFKYPN